MLNNMCLNHLILLMFDYSLFICTHSSDDHPSQILVSVPRALRSEICAHLYMDKVASSPLFRDCDAAFLKAVCAALVPRLYLPDETIVAADDVTDTMFFVESGSCHVMASNQISFAGALGAGHAFGEIAFFCQRPHKVTVRAVGHMDVAVLHLATLEELYRTHTNGAMSARRAGFLCFLGESNACVFGCWSNLFW